MEIRELLKILFRRRSIIAFVAGSFLLLVGAITALAPKSYKATAKVIVEEPDKLEAIATSLGLQGLILDTRVDSEVSFDTDLELLMIGPLVNRLIVEMNLCDSEGELLKSDDFVDGGFKNKMKGQPAVSIEQYNDTALISIEADSTDPEHAAEIANRLANMYIEERITRTIDDFGEVKRVVDAGMARIRDDYFSKLNDLKDFRQRTGFINLDTVTESLLNQIVELENGRADYQRGIASFNETIKLAKAELEKTEKIWESGFELGQNTVSTDLKQRLSGLLVELSGIAVNVTEKHPDYKILRAQIDELATIVKNEPELSTARKQFTVNPVFESLYRSISENILSVQGTLARLETIEKQIGEYKERLLTLPALQNELTKLSMDVSVSSAIYSSLMEYSLKIGLAESAAAAKIRLVEPAIAPDADNPNFPKKAVNLILGIIFGVFFGVSAAFVIDYADDSVRDTNHLRNLGANPCFGSLPVSRSLRKRSILQTDDQRLMESLRNMRDTLLFESGARCSDGGIIVVASTAPGGGAGTVAAGLARALAEKGGGVALADFNLRARSRRDLHNSKPQAAGVAESLAEGGAIPDGAIVPSQIKGLSLLAAGALTSDAGPILQDEAVDNLLKELRSRFRFVVVDAPPVGVYNDAITIAVRAEVVALVARTGAARKPDVAHCLDKLRIAGDRLVGTILNLEGYSLPLLHGPRAAAALVLRELVPRRRV